MSEGKLSAGFVVREVAIRTNMPIRTVIVNLPGLRKLKFDVSFDRSTFLGTARLTPIVKLFNGLYIHFDLEECPYSFEDHGGSRSRYLRIANLRRCSRR